MNARGASLRATALALWWAPSDVASELRRGMRVAAALGASYRLARVRRLIDRGRLREAGRVLRVLRQEAEAFAQPCVKADVR